MKSDRASIGGVLILGMAVVLAPSGATAATHIVNPGDSIQAAVDGASDGDVIKVNPGDYYGSPGATDAVLITKRLKMIARKTKTEGVRILPCQMAPVPCGPGDENQNGMVIRGTPSTPIQRPLVKGFTVEGFPNHGIWLEYTNKFKLKNNVSADNLHNGIFPTLSTNGLVKNNVAYGALDAGLWVEASENVRVIKNEVYNNPTGLELTISKKILVKGNDIYGNTVGLGLYHPNGAGLPYPGTPGVPFDDDWDVIGNDIYDNNLPNPVVGGLVGALPTGIGTLLIGVDNVTMLKNQISGNWFVGLAVVNWCDFNNCTTSPPVDANPLPNNNSIIANTVTGNGRCPNPAGGGGLDCPDPVPGHTVPNPNAFLATDIVAFAPGAVGNCYSNNTVDSSIPPVLAPEC